MSGPRTAGMSGEPTNRITSSSGEDTETAATMTTTATRQQLRGDLHGLGASSSSGQHYQSRNGSNYGKPNTWGSGPRLTSDARASADKAWSGSWSALQNIASTVLGSGKNPAYEEEEERKRRARIAERRRRAALDRDVVGKSSNSAASRGSSCVRSRVGVSGMGDGEGDLRTRGRRKLDEQNEPSASCSQPQRPASVSSLTASPLDNRELQKRASSPVTTPTNRASSSPPSTDRGESDTFAYVHKVRSTDTLEGVVIMFNIHPSALRRANRLWMGDSIQVRKELYLPVDECLVKGRPLTQGEGEEEEEKRRENAKANSNDTREGPDDSGKVINGTRAPYQHHSYVMISGIGKVEIARLSRNKLSHFPPRRRQHGVSVSSTISENGFLDPNEANASVFKTGGRNVSEAYTGVSGVRMGAGGEVPTLGQMFNQVAKETRDGVENVGSFVEGFVRKVVVKVGEMAREGGEAAIELVEQVSQKDQVTERGQARCEGDNFGAGSARERPGARLRGRLGNTNAGTSSAGPSRTGSRTRSRPASLSRNPAGSMR